ncbi:hypothetical protein KM043_005691 [Ampulex compressa]|nr:hypothetical protein KM043_005691 [Ampulex compressa]
MRSQSGPEAPRIRIKHSSSEFGCQRNSTRRPLCGPVVALTSHREISLSAERDDSAISPCAGSRINGVSYPSARLSAPRVPERVDAPSRVAKPRAFLSSILGSMSGFGTGEDERCRV